MSRQTAFILVLILLIVGFTAYKKNAVPSSVATIVEKPQEFIGNNLSVTVASVPTLPKVKILPGTYQTFQTFNNCGPAALSIALGHYGIIESQQKLGQDLRPYQNQAGDNDDKSTTLDELAEKSKEYGFTPYYRPNGNQNLVKQFITLDVPVITRTLLHTNEDIGHYRVIKGYDDITNEFIQDDSLQGANLRYSYDEFNTLWKQFNYEYLVLIPKEKREKVKQILGDEVDEKKSWEKAAMNSRKELYKNPNDIFTRFNLVVALQRSGKSKEAIGEYEKIETSLPFRTLWYQIEPILAYEAVGNYDKVFSMTDQILNNQNRAFSELYIIRGRIYKNRGQTNEAQAEFERAVFYNSNLKNAQKEFSEVL